MSTLKKFFIYFVLFVGFLGLSFVLENGLLTSMYEKIEGKSINGDNLSVEVTDARSTSSNGYMKMKITNDSGEYIEEGYARIDLLDEYGNVAMSEYVTVSDLQAGGTKDLEIKYSGNNITGYNVELVPEIPEEKFEYDLFGWKIDPENVFGSGMNIDNFTVLGFNVGKYLKPALKYTTAYARAGWKWGLSVARSVPGWAYVIASIIVLWYL